MDGARRKSRQQSLPSAEASALLAKTLLLLVSAKRAGQMHDLRTISKTIGLTPASGRRDGWCLKVEGNKPPSAGQLFWPRRYCVGQRAGQMILRTISKTMT